MKRSSLSSFDNKCLVCDEPIRKFGKSLFMHDRCATKAEAFDAAEEAKISPDASLGGDGEDS